MMLQLADRSLKAPQGVIKDVLVQVEKFYYPLDVVVLDMQQFVSNIYQAPIIRGQPFLATSDVLINGQSRVLKLTFGNMTLEMNVFNKMPIRCDDSEVYAVDMVDDLDMLELLSAFGSNGAFENEAPKKPEVSNEKVPLIKEILESEGQSTKIDAVPVRDARWRPNPTMMEVIKKKVLKMLDIICPTTDMSCGPWFDDIVNCLATNQMPKQRVTWDKRHFFVEIKIILEKTGCPNRNAWFEKLFDALSAYQTTFKKNLGTSPYRLIYGLRKLQVCEFQEYKRKVYDNDRLAKKRMKLLHKIKDKQLFPNQQDLHCNSRYHLFSRKLRS
ncbi:uncharacterized protein LOC131166708 [Malania oleifera]|uniref:uncharacterized protein LOC131166708 n=1 Tax=Malania oleifera TaxID=397392 RepID=UPI0025AEB5B3|nr:uncharacterized protein LOC131166708 [Malania oleifera]